MHMVHSARSYRIIEMLSTPAKRPWPFADTQTAAVTHPSPQALKHVLDLSDWLNVSPYQVDVDFSPHTRPPTSRPYIDHSGQSPIVDPHYFTTPTPSSLGTNNDASSRFSGLNDAYLSADSAIGHPLTPLQTVHLSELSTQSLDAAHLSEAFVGEEDIEEHLSHRSASQPSVSTLTGPVSISSLPATPELFSLATNSLSIDQTTVSPVTRRSECNGSPVSTLSAAEEDEFDSHAREPPTLVTTEVIVCPSEGRSLQDAGSNSTFMDKLCSTSSSLSTKPASSSSRFNNQQSSNPLDSPIQLRPSALSQRTPLSSSSLSSVINEAYTHHESHSDHANSGRPLKRFRPSLLSINLTPSYTDAFTLKKLRVFEADRHRYRTRSKLRSLRAEIESVEKEEDLGIIRSFLTNDVKSLGEEFRQARRQTRSFAATNPSSEVVSALKAVGEDSPVKPSAASSPVVSHMGSSNDDYSDDHSKTLHSCRKSKITTRGRRNTEKNKCLTMHTDSSVSSPAPTKKARHRTDIYRNAKKTVPASTSVLNSRRSSPDTPPCMRVDEPIRTFPLAVSVNAFFPLLYRKFPLCSYFDPHSKIHPKFSGSQPGGLYNPPRNVFDLYTPRFVKGMGRDKVGLCPICFEKKDRGGAGKAEWLSMKFSAFKYYHMQYAHGISPTTTLPFSPPLTFRTVYRQPALKNEKCELREGKCHKCQSWVPVEGVKCVEAKLKEIYWWKHAATCHKGSTIDGETDVHLEDELSLSILKLQ